MWIRQAKTDAREKMAPFQMWPAGGKVLQLFLISKRTFPPVLLKWICWIHISLFNILLILLGNENHALQLDPIDLLNAPTKQLLKSQLEKDAKGGRSKVSLENCRFFFLACPWLSGQRWGSQRPLVVFLQVHQSLDMPKGLSYGLSRKGRLSTFAISTSEIKLKSNFFSRSEWREGGKEENLSVVKFFLKFFLCF